MINNRPEMSLDHRMGWLEGNVDALEKRMTRREAEDAAWREDMKSRMSDTATTLSEISNKLSQSFGAASVLKWIATGGGVACITAAGWVVAHFWSVK